MLAISPLLGPLPPPPKVLAHVLMMAPILEMEGREALAVVASVEHLLALQRGAKHAPCHQYVPILSHSWPNGALEVGLLVYVLQWCG